MSTLQRVAHIRGFDRCGCNIGDVRSICERAGCSGSWVRSGTLPLVETSLGSQTLAVIGEKIGFKAISN